MKAGDRLPSISKTLGIDLTGATVQFHFRSKFGGIEFLRAATIVTALTGVVQYDWQAGDTDVVGIYLAEWIITSAAKERTFPAASYDIVNISARL